MPEAPTPGMVSVRDAARRIGINAATLYDAIKRGDDLPFPIVRIGHRILIPAAALDRVLAVEPKSQVSA